jgi:hypothetical protein
METRLLGEARLEKRKREEREEKEKHAKKF